jgi:protein-disulfide isomerase
MHLKSPLAVFKRRIAKVGVALAGTLALAACGSGGGGPGGAAAGDMAMGAGPDAKVTVVEYASVTCHVCAAWQQENWAAFKARYVDTKQVRYVFREIPTPPTQVATAGFLIARCAGEDRYFDVVHTLLSSQAEMQADPRTTLFRVGNGAGLSNSQIEQCLTDEAALEAVDDRAKAARDAGVTGTPTFFVNGTQVPGTPGVAWGTNLENISAAIEAELAKG